MALNFFKQRDIDEMDINDIPEEFINYVETLDEIGKVGLLASRPDIAKVLGVSIKDSNQDKAEMVQTEDSSLELSVISDEDHDGLGSENVELDDDVTEEVDEEFIAIQNNRYDGKKITEVLKDNMEPLEALAVPDKTDKCIVHRIPFIEKQIKYTGKGATYGVVLKVCPQCNRIYMEESGEEYIHEALTKRNIAHTFYSLETSSRYLRSQLSVYEFSDQEKIYIPEIWTEDNPLCSVHEEPLFEVPCIKKYKDRKVEFIGYFCDKCNKIHVRSSAVAEIEDNCALNGVPVIETESLVKKQPKKSSIKVKDIKPDYIVEDGKREIYAYKHTADCFKLTEADTVIVSDSIYCTLEGHETEEVLAQIWINQKKGGRKSYIFVVGYCAQCQKYYMDIDDYNVIYPIGRPEVTIISDLNESDYQITSGEVFNLEKNHLEKIESGISGEIEEIHGSSDYVNPYAVGDYDDGNLSFAKSLSANKYGKRLEELENYIPKPYSYRVDITADGETETYYIGVADVVLKDGKKVISANSDLGYELINYQTIKVHKDGKEYSIKLSRQFDIDHASLYGYTNLRTDEDVIFQSGITDPFLVRVLNMRKKQHSLTDIFVTIQENQNKIVNTDFKKNIIVQGCAGSGKTMVLLHRLSALKYKQRYFDFSQNALILTPNEEFSLHIQGLAEGLQIGSVHRLSVEQYYLEMLLQYDAAFKPENKIVSEMQVRQDYVDYIYSDQFKRDFDQAYNSILAKRNGLVDILIQLQEAMGLENNPFSWTDESRFTVQMKYRVDTLNDLVRKKEQDVVSAQEKITKLEERKAFLEDRIPASKHFAENIVQESLPRVNTKIGEYILEKQQEITELNKKIQDLQEEYTRIQGTLIMFGKRSRLEKLDADIKEVEAVVIPLQQQLDEQKKILSIEQEGKEDDEILAWMKQVSIYVKKVQDEVRLCSNTKDEYSRFSNELNETVDNIKIAYEKYHRIDAEQYSADIKKTVQYLYEQLEQYSLLNIYHQIYDESVRVFKETNAIKSITGKCHRYDLYIQLMFAMRYFNKKIGNMQFICVDEGQDLAVNEYRLLLELNQNNVVFNIFGDTNQLMKSGRGIADWSLMMSEFHAEQYVLNENYRNTNQITRFCNDNFGLQTLQTGVDGPKVREIPRRDLEKELAGLKVTTERVAILLPRTVQKMKYLDMDILPENTRKIIGETMDNGFISIMYVDEVKGIEFDKVFVVSAKMRRNEKYIAYTRALSELIIVVDETVVSYDTESDKNQKVNTNKSEKKIRDKNRKSAALKWERKEKKQEVKNIESLSVQVFAGEKAIPFNQIIVEDATRFKKPVQELLENIENYYLKYGKLDLPIWVSVKEGVYVLEDNYAQYVVASKLKLEQVNTICVDGAAKIQENPVTNLSEKEERNLPEVQDEEKEAEQINSELIIHISCIYKNAKNKCYNVNCIENVGKRCTQEEKCVFYIAATEELSVSEENEIEMDIKNAEIYLRNSEIGKHHKIIKSQPEYFEGIRSIPINQIDVPACFKKNRPAEKKIDALLEYYEEHGCLDKPVTVVFRNNKYVLKDKFLRYYVGKMLKLKKIDAICTVD